MSGYHPTVENVSADEALRRLKEGNELFRSSLSYSGEVTGEKMREAVGGQRPYAAVVSCSDSRVIPEVVFSAGLGELFVVRTAGIVADGVNTMGSLEYAVGCLGCKLILVLGHTGCGAIAQALKGPIGGNGFGIVHEISSVIGDERDPMRMIEINVRNTMRRVEAGMGQTDGLRVVGGCYDLATGSVTFYES